MKAAMQGHTSIVTLLVNGGADIDITDDDGEDAEDLAYLHGYPNVGNFLKNKRAAAAVAANSDNNSYRDWHEIWHRD